jgi:glucan-binding YG repeat protein
VDHKITYKNGIREEGGKLYYYENNVKVKAGVISVDGDLYYFGMNYYALADGEYYIPENMTNGLIAAGRYLIEDGKIVIRNGVYEQNGKLYYYENNVKVKAGAVYVDGDLYYFGMNYYALADGTYVLPESMLNGLIPAGVYTIQDGKIIL